MADKTLAARKRRTRALLASGEPLVMALCPECGEEFLGANEMNARNSLGQHRARFHGYTSAANRVKQKVPTLPDHLKRYQDGRTVNSAALWYAFIHTLPRRPTAQ